MAVTLRALGLLVLVAGASTFQAPPALRPVSLSANNKHSLRTNLRPYVAPFSLQPRIPQQKSTAVSMSGSDLVASEMDERIYSFNKIVIDTVYDIICFLYPVTGGKRDFARFYVLETVARVPYFAYLSVMHLRETFGERDPKLGERMRTHYAEADNELHHLLIMESLGGNSSIVDRTLAQVSCARSLPARVRACVRVCVWGSACTLCVCVFESLQRSVLCDVVVVSFCLYSCD